MLVKRAPAQRVSNADIGNKILSIRQLGRHCWHYYNLQCHRWWQTFQFGLSFVFSKNRFHDVIVFPPFLVGDTRICCHHVFNMANSESYYWGSRHNNGYKAIKFQMLILLEAICKEISAKRVELIANVSFNVPAKRVDSGLPLTRKLPGQRRYQVIV